MKLKWDGRVDGEMVDVKKNKATLREDEMKESLGSEGCKVNGVDGLRV